MGRGAPGPLCSAFLTFLPGARERGSVDMGLQSRRMCGRLAVLGVAAGVFMAPGCGWTPRDEYLHAQRSVVRASIGDGSRAPLAIDWEGPRPVTTATVANAP